MMWMSNKNKTQNDSHLIGLLSKCNAIRSFESLECLSVHVFSWFSLFISLQSIWQSKSWLKPPLIANKWLNTQSEGWRSFLSPVGFCRFWGWVRAMQRCWTGPGHKVRPSCCGQLPWWIVLPPLPLVQSGSPKSILLYRVVNMKEIIKFAQIREDCRKRLQNRTGEAVLFHLLC